MKKKIYILLHGHWTSFHNGVVVVKLTGKTGAVGSSSGLSSLSDVSPMTIFPEKPGDCIGVARKFQIIRTKGKKAKFVSKIDKKILATFNFLHYALAYCA